MSPNARQRPSPLENTGTSQASAKREDTITPKTHASDLSASEIVKLRVRADTHNQKVKNIMLRLLPSDNLTTVYKYVKQYINNPNLKGVELFTSFPKKSYPESMTGTLKELGLAPTCALVAKLV
jgi:hypothetical protein